MAPKVLIVDDDPLMHQLYGRHLAQAGYQVVTAESGEQALELVEKERPQLIVMDVNMPGIGGVAALRELKAQPATRSIPVIVVTSVTEYHLCEKEARTVGATVFLTKPFGPAQLLAEIRRLLG